MASGKVAHQSAIQTYSRFAALEEDSEEEKIEKENAEKKNNAAKNAKRRARKKKKAVAETNDLRNLAFSKPVSAKVIQNVHQQRHAVPEAAVNGMSQPSMQHATNIPIENIDDNWEEWKNKDEAFVVDQFQKDLENALRLSAESQPQQQASKVKKKVKTMSLDEFVAKEQDSVNTYEQAPPIVPHMDSFYIPNGYSPEELDPNHYDTCIDDMSHVSLEPPTTTNIPTPTKKKKKKKKPVDNNTLSEVLHELHTEERTESSTTTQVGSIDAASFASWQNEIEEKEKEINKLKELNEQLKDELGQVKKRNKQFCFILAQGEMKDKSEILLQVDDLTNIKNELSEELAEMHIALEQERSKVSSLKAELEKQQNQRTKSKSVSEEK